MTTLQDLGLAYRKVGNKAGAASEFRRVLELAPGGALAQQARQALDAVK